jgi:hypothetical protein
MNVRHFHMFIVALFLHQPAFAESIIDSESTAPPEVAEAIEANVLQWAYYWNPDRYSTLGYVSVT